MAYIAEPVSKTEAKQAFKSRLPPWRIHSGEWLTFSINKSFRDSEKVTPTSSKQLGSIALRITDKAPLSAEVGFIVKPSQQGNGYATQALGLLIAYARNQLGVERFQAVCACENASSIKVLEKLGFERHKTLLENSFIQGRWLDDVVLHLNKVSNV